MKPSSEQHELGSMISLKTFSKVSHFLLKKGLLLLSLLLLSGVAAEGVRAEADGPCEGGGNERYVDCGNGTVTDQETGLIWLKDANCAIFGLKSWADTTSAVADLADGQCGLTDGSSPGEWHLPFHTDFRKTVAKAKEKGCSKPSLTDVTGEHCYKEGQQPFINVQSGFYWTAATYPNRPGTTWTLGAVDTTSYDYRDQAYGWPVRGNESGINKESCKDKGWQQMGFKNQGQCIKSLK